MESITRNGLKLLRLSRLSRDFVEASPKGVIADAKEKKTGRWLERGTAAKRTSPTSAALGAVFFALRL